MDTVAASDMRYLDNCTLLALALVTWSATATLVVALPPKGNPSSSLPSTFSIDTPSSDGVILSNNNMFPGGGGAMSLANPLLAVAASDRPEGCPPCFNCLLDAFPCSHFSPCNAYDGRCTCPPGFAGDNCSVPGKTPKQPNSSISMCVWTLQRQREENGCYMIEMTARSCMTLRHWTSLIERQLQKGI